MGAGERPAMWNEPQVGTVFAARYEVLSVLGAGGTGIVYKVRDLELDDVVAIKTLRRDALSENPSLFDCLRQEIRLARRITHPNVLRTHDLGESNGSMFLSMEFVKGTTLKQLVESGGTLPATAGLQIAKQLCAGLAAAHEAGVIHRDVKPQNIIIESSGGLKILDFGTARVIADPEATGVTGTPDYMSPEQVRGLPLDCRSDIYSTGVVLYEVFTGSLPFQGDSPLAVVLQHVGIPAPHPRSKNPWIEPRVASILMKCLEKDPGARFQSMGELYVALAKVITRLTN